jgi:hypothetical protein
MKPRWPGLRWNTTGPSTLNWDKALCNAYVRHRDTGRPCPSSSDLSRVHLADRTAFLILQGPTPRA